MLIALAAQENTTLDDVPGGSATLIFLVSITAILLLVLLFSAMLIGAHRRYRALQESLRAEEREVSRLRSQVDLWTESAKRLKAEAGDEVDEDDEDEFGDRGDDDDEDTDEIR